MGQKTEKMQFGEDTLFASKAKNITSNLFQLYSARHDMAVVLFFLRIAIFWIFLLSVKEEEVLLPRE